MWKKLRELSIGVTFTLASHRPSMYEILEVQVEGLLIQSLGGKPELWNWEEVESNDLVWVEV